MAPVAAASIIQSCLKGGNDYHVARAIYLEVRGGYSNKIVQKMRFSNFLRSKLPKWCSRSNHTSVQRLLEDLNNYNTVSMSERSKFLNKVSVLMGYTNIRDLIEQEKARGESDAELISAFDIDFPAISAKFPCIKIGDSSFIELYDEASSMKYEENMLSQSVKNYIPNSDGKLEIADGFVDKCHLLGPSFTNVDPLSISEESSFLTQHTCQEPAGAKDTCVESLSEARTPEMVILDRPIRDIPGITGRLYNELEKSGFHTVRKLLHHFPRTYLDLQNAQGPMEDGQYVMIVGTILSSSGNGIPTKGMGIIEILVGCSILDGGSTSAVEDCICGPDQKKTVCLHLKKFYTGKRYAHPYVIKSMASKYKEGALVYVSGKVKKLHANDHYEVKEHCIDMLEEEQKEYTLVQRKPYPVYPSKAGLDRSFLSSSISRALKMLTADIDPMPSEVLTEFNLPNLFQAYMGIHKPNNRVEADIARKRLIFDDFFYLQLARLFQMLQSLGTMIEKEELLDKYKNYELNVVPIDEWSPLTKSFLKALPYSLTPGQLNATKEIIWDLRRPVPMNKLLQGDVGCGKTVVAFLACMEVISSGFQVAFMVPTELLAIQHFEHITSLLENFEGDECKPNIALLTGSTSCRETRTILNGLRTGDISMVIGTHSLIADRIEFSALRLSVVDEQQRFGVIQRGRFNSKLYASSQKLSDETTNPDEASDSEAFMAPHILAMSATPIPRTMALVLYGDMSLTEIADLPPGRQPTETTALEGNDDGLENVYQMMNDELVDGGRIYLVYPIIQESAHLPQVRAAVAEFDYIKQRFEGYPCGLLHGRMKGVEKDEALKSFRSGATCILVATHVIEVGVDVPDASMMVVMNAERFGIAQLHQLRGRVGRGARKSRCVFLSSTASSLQRLKVLEKSSDGFYLAKADLLMRGPGDLLGKKQSGHLPEFPVARLDIDGNLIQEAHLAALKVLGASNDLGKYPRLKMELSMRQPLCILGD